MFTEDLDPFFNDFAIQVRINGEDITAIFSDNFVDAEGIASTNPHLIVKSSDIPDIENEDEVEAKNTMYQVASIQPDGTGISTIFLEKKWHNT
jgi:hypothetical protein